MKTGMITFLMSTFALISQAQNDSDLLRGNWNIKAPSAPYGYQEGKISFHQTEDKLTADVSLTYANFQLDQLKKESFGYSCSECIDGSTVYIKFFITEKNGKKELKAVAEADGQVIDVQLTRTNKQKDLPL